MQAILQSNLNNFLPQLSRECLILTLDCGRIWTKVFLRAGIGNLGLSHTKYRKADNIRAG